jgi:nucleotide-binding universal stress UspA family protein
MPVTSSPAQPTIWEFAPVYERIVAAIDRDLDRANQVVQAAQEMGRAFGSSVLVVHVRDVERKASSLVAAGRPGALPPAIHFETEESAQELVDGAVQKLHHAGVTAKGEVGPGAGSTARELLDMAHTFGANRIVVGDRDSRVTDVILGGVAHRIVHLADCPVLLVR